MKFFSKLLVAPAALGLLVPLSVSATEINMEGVSSYYSAKTKNGKAVGFDSSTFSNKQSVQTPASLLAGGEGMVDSNNYDSDTFSETTTMTGEATFLIGAADGDKTHEGDGHQVTKGNVGAAYYFALDLNTSFTGSDNLNIGLETGNGSNTSGTLNRPIDTALDFGAANGDILKVHNVHYSSTIGDNLSYIVGDSLDVSSAFTGACVYNSFTDSVSNCGTANSAGLGSGDDVAVSALYDAGNGITIGAGVGTGTANRIGMFTKESNDSYALQLAYSDDLYGLAATYGYTDTSSTDTAYYGLNGYYSFENAPVESVSLGYETSDPETGSGGSGWFAGLNFSETGPGSFALGVATYNDINGSTLTDDGADEAMIYELSYSWDINDGMSATVGTFLQERTTAGDEDLTGLAMTTTFSF